MAMLIDCPSVPVSESEKAEITEAAYNARSENRSVTDFESVSITKCVTDWKWPEPKWVQGRTENVEFHGLFPHTVKTDSYRELYVVRCHKSVDYRDNVVFDKRVGCTEELERYMQYGGLENEIQLRGNISVEDATAYLDHLMQYNFGKDTQTRIDGMLQQIQWVDREIRKGKLRFRASFNHGGCSMTSFEATADRNGSLAFGEVDGYTYDC